MICTVIFVFTNVAPPSPDHFLSSTGIDGGGDKGGGVVPGLRFGVFPAVPTFGGEISNGLGIEGLAATGISIVGGGTFTEVPGEAAVFAGTSRSGVTELALLEGAPGIVKSRAGVCTCGIAIWPGGMLGDGMLGLFSGSSAITAGGN